MPKKKTHRGAAKRFRLTGGGKIRRSQANKSHLLTHKGRQRKRALRKGALVSAADQSTIRALIGPGA